MSVAKQSFEFVRSFEPWQQDLFLRAAAAPTLSPDDERAALDLLLDDESCGKARRVTPDDFVQAPDAGEPLQLLGIENPTDVNALASGAVLRFDRASLNIVYGDNGAGALALDLLRSHVLDAITGALALDPLRSHVLDAITCALAVDLLRSQILNAPTHDAAAIDRPGGCPVARRT